MISRDQLLEALRGAVEPDARVHAMWLGGSFAFGADDEHSDLDAVVVVDDDAVEKLFAQIEVAIAKLAPVAVRHRIPEPAWHGFSQCFYRLESMREEHLLDLCLVPISKVNSFNEEELHGRPVVLFDRADCQKTVALDRDRNREAMEKRRAAIAERHELFGNGGPTLLHRFPIAVSIKGDRLLTVRAVEEHHGATVQL
ncbi:MAG: nucleotidyltransferase domain-containing protein, partial [Planctomycetota bacterium]